MAAEKMGAIGGEEAASPTGGCVFERAELGDFEHRVRAQVGLSPMYFYVPIIRTRTFERVSFVILFASEDVGVPRRWMGAFGGRVMGSGDCDLRGRNARINGWMQRSSAGTKDFVVLNA